MLSLIIDGILFRFYVPQTVFGIDVEAKPHLVKKAFLNVVEKYSLLEILFLKNVVKLMLKLPSFLNSIIYNLTAIKSAE